MRRAAGATNRVLIVLMIHFASEIKHSPVRLAGRFLPNMDPSRTSRLTGNRMVAYCDYGSSIQSLGRCSRRELLDRLRADNGQTLNELCTCLKMTRQAVSKHLGILEEANLVATVKQGREKLHYLNPMPIHDIAERWIGKFERQRLQALSELKKGLEARDE